MGSIFGRVSTTGTPQIDAMQAVLSPSASVLIMQQPHVTLGQEKGASSLQTLLTNEAKYLTLSFAGSLTNFRELREELLGLGYIFATRHPAEVVVHLYEQYGADMLPLLRGPFALALWDQQARRLLLACDAMRQRPLFYAPRADGLLFASDVRLLLTHSETPPASVFADRTFLMQTLSSGSLPPDATAFQGIVPLAAGHTLTWAVDAPQGALACYWQPPALTPPEPRASIVEYEDEVREQVANSVRLHVASHEFVGVLLSGGLNSSLVAAMMPQQNRVLHTFTGRFGTEDTPETLRAAQVAAHLGAEHHALALPVPDLKTLLPSLIAQTAQPLITPAMLLMALLSEAVQGQMAVALTGVGGLLLLGNPLPEAAPRPRRPMWQAAATFLQRTRISRQREAQRAADALALLPPAVIAALTGITPTMGRPVPPITRLEEMIAALPTTHLTPLFQVGAAHGLDVRFPFMEASVIAAAAQLPLNLRQRPGQPLYVLQEVSYGLLPASLCTPLPAVPLPLAAWLREQEAFVRDVLHPSHTRGLWHTPALTGLIDAHMHGTADHAAALLALLSLTLWHQLFGGEEIV